MAQRQPEYSGPSILEILLLVLIIAGAVAGGLYAFGIVPPDSGNGGSDSSRQATQVLRTPVPTPFFPPTSNVPLSTAPVSTATAPTGGQTGVQSGSQTTPLTATSAPAGSQAQSPGTRTEPDDTLSPPATVDPTGSTNPPTSAPAPGAPSWQPATPAPVPAPAFDGIYTLTVSQPTNEDFAGKVI